jgi:hypothetical protein
MGVAQGGQGHALGVTPWPTLPLLSGLCHAVVMRGVEKRNSRADMRGPAAVTASKGGETHGAKRQRQLAGLGARTALVAGLASWADRCARGGRKEEGVVLGRVAGPSGWAARQA